MVDLTNTDKSLIKVQELMRCARAEDAALLCEKICEHDSGNVDAWLIRGQILGQLSRYAEAKDCFKAVVDMRPDSAMAHYLLGAVFQALNDDRNAIHNYKRAISIKSDYVDALNNLGVVLQKTGNFEAAADNYEKVIEISPQHAGALYNLGLVKLSLGLAGEAVKYFRKSLNLNPEYALIYQSLGSAYTYLGNDVEAEDCFRQAITRDQNLAESHFNLGKLHCKNGKLQDAKYHISVAVQLTPKWPEARVELGNLLSDLNEIEAAIQHYCAALKDRPESAVIHYNLAHALQALLKYPEAAEHYRAALHFEPSLLEAYNNLGIVCQDMGHFDEAMNVYDKAISVAELQSPAPSGARASMPSDVEVEIRWHRSLLLLLMGDFAHGWQEYEWRWAGNAARKRGFLQPLWDGSDLAGKNILVYGEQGIGDEIMFASCFNDLISKAGHTVIDCDKRLVSLFQRSFPNAVVHGGPQDSDISWLDQVVSLDVRVPSGSLPRFLRKNTADYSPKRYLVCDPVLEAEWRSRFSDLDSKYVIGISWRSGNASKSQLRSTQLLQWLPVLSIQDVAFVNLQYGDCKGDLEELHKAAAVTVHDWDDADPLTDLDGFAAQISALDLVISIDNSTVHMAGALAVPTWIAQPYAPEWRWGANEKGSYWYSNIRQFRQQKTGDWDGVFGEIAMALRQYIDDRS